MLLSSGPAVSLEEKQLHKFAMFIGEKSIKVPGAPRDKGIEEGSIREGEGSRVGECRSN